jgi:hypothetical protein
MLTCARRLSGVPWNPMTSCARRSFSLLEMTAWEKKKSNVNLERVKVHSSFEVAAVKLDDIITSCSAQFDAVAYQCTVLFQDGISDALNSAKNELLQSRQDVKEFVGVEKGILAGLAQQVAGSGADDLKALKARCDVIMKGVVGKTSFYKNFCRDLRLFKATLDAVSRKKKMDLGANANATARPGPPPLYTICMTIAPEEKCNLNTSTSVFEAKLGLKPALLAPAVGTDPFTELMKNAKSKKLNKDITTHLKAHSSGTLLVSDTTHGKFMTKQLKKAFDATLFTQMPMPPDAEWMPQVYGHYLFGTNDDHLSVGFTHMGMMEVRVLFEGSETVLGIPTRSLPGDDLKEKRRMLFQMTIDDIKKLVDPADGGAGFATWHDSTKALVIPSGFFIVVVGPASRGLRWSLCSDDGDTNRVKLMLGSMIASFPEMGNPSTGCSQFLAWINST